MILVKRLTIFFAVLAVAFIKYGAKGFGETSSLLSKTIGGIMLASGALLVLGLFTQAAALGVMALLTLIKILKSKRIGVDYAQHCREYLWRFNLKL